MSTPSDIDDLLRHLESEGLVLHLGIGDATLWFAAEFREHMIAERLAMLPDEPLVSVATAAAVLNVPHSTSSPRSTPPPWPARTAAVRSGCGARLWCGASPPWACPTRLPRRALEPPRRPRAGERASIAAGFPGALPRARGGFRPLSACPIR